MVKQVTKPATCDWHADDKPLDDDLPVHCPSCGRLLETKDCESCGKEFLDWEFKTADDVVGSPCANSRGDLCCSGCIAWEERQIQQAEDECDSRTSDYFDGGE